MLGEAIRSEARAGAESQLRTLDAVRAAVASANPQITNGDTLYRTQRRQLQKLIRTA